MKQKIQFTGKNLNEIFALPCVYRIEKDFSTTLHGRIIDKSPKNVYVVARVGNSVRSDILIVEYGDWLVQDDKGFWHVEKGDNNI